MLNLLFRCSLVSLLGGDTQIRCSYLCLENESTLQGMDEEQYLKKFSNHLNISEFNYNRGGHTLCLTGRKTTHKKLGGHKNVSKKAWWANLTL